MGSDDEFGRDTATIRAWLDKRATYAADREVPLPPIPVARASTTTAAPADRSRYPDAHDTGRSVVDLLGPIEVDEPVAPEPEEPTTPEPPVVDRDPAPAAPRAETTPSRPPARQADDDLPPAVIEFKPRTHVRRALSVLLTCCLVVLAAAAVWAAQQPTGTTIGVASTLALLLLVVWAVRASTNPTRLTIRRGQLEVARNGQRRLIELASPYTPVAIVGTPGRRGWQVLIEQLDAPMLTLSAADVEPEAFTRVLLRLRPDLRPSTAE